MGDAKNACASRNDFLINALKFFGNSFIKIRIVFNHNVKNVGCLKEVSRLFSLISVSFFINK